MLYARGSSCVRRRFGQRKRSFQAGRAQTEFGHEGNANSEARPGEAESGNLIAQSHFRAPVHLADSRDLSSQGYVGRADLRRGASPPNGCSTFGGLAFRVPEISLSLCATSLRFCATLSGCWIVILIAKVRFRGLGLCCLSGSSSSCLNTRICGHG